MARRKTGKSNRAAAKGPQRKAAKFKLPRAFQMIPVPIKGPRKRHAHLLGAPGIPPCPPGCTFLLKIKINDHDYCVYLCPGGVNIVIEC